MYLFEIVEGYDPFLRKSTYGILEKCFEDGETHEAAFIPGISCDKEFVQQLLERCEENQVSPIHMQDVVMDALLSE